ncbi:MAG: hypothetical protein K5893_10750 [Prevotella sp.]|nr:hypothetical protein [Prevotella sp.]
MKKVAIFAVGAALLLSSCGSYTASGAYTGSSLGSILGSAIGGLTGGPRGSDWGTIIGMAGGAVVGGAIGNAADQSRRQQIEEYHQRAEARSAHRSTVGQDRYDNSQNYGDNGYYDPQNGGDDRIDLGIAGAPGSQAGVASPRLSAESGALVISNIRYLDDNGDQMLGAGEVAKIAFDLKNTSNQTLYNVKPIVVETTGNRHILVSPSINVESIAPGSGIRYTATVVGDRSLRRGTAQFEVSAETDGKVNVSGGQVFDINTKR